MPDKSAEKARFAKFVDSEIWELLRNLEMGKVDCLSVEAKLNAAHEKALTESRNGAIEEAAKVAEGYKPTVEERANDLTAYRIAQAIRALETSLDLQRQEFEKLNIEQANRIVELEKVNRKMREALERIVTHGCGCNPACLCEQEENLKIWKEEVKSLAKEALAEESHD